MQRLINDGKQIVGLRFGTVCGVSPNTRSDLFLNSMIHHAHAYKLFWVKNLNSTRSVLGIKDLVHAVSNICANKFVPGIYNLKSFDITMQQAADHINQQLGVPYQVREPDAISYDFRVNQQLFCNTYSWQPSQTLQSIITDLSQDYNSYTWCARPSWPQGTSYAI